VTNALREIVRRHKAGEATGVYSVCSAHPMVLAAAVLQAVEDYTVVLIEATSNQVDQYGGYTGMRPADFRDLVYRVADAHGLPRERVVLGGDHLGPNVWRGLGAEEAMSRAEALVAAYVSAGFTKIHLDCSMACAGDKTPLTDDVVAERAARLVRVAEATAAREPGGAESIVYVIGTEVPVPGGAHETIDTLTATTPEAARATIAAHQEAFARFGVAEAWERVMALVVQPGVEFDHDAVFDYDPTRTGDLRRVVDDHPGLVFEAHSTDYQTVEGLTALVKDHWAVLKVGPGLTFALREALFALAAIEDELVATDDRSDLVGVIERRMLADPTWWLGYYEGDAAEQRLARRYSYSDRMRYYMPDSEVRTAQARLFANLRVAELSLPMLSQYLPLQYNGARHGRLALAPEAIAIDHVRDVLRDYSRACNPVMTRSPRTMTTVLGYPAQEIDARDARWTSREITQQPALWREVGRTAVAEHSATEAFLRPVLERPGLRIVLTGAGTSAFAGEILAPALSRSLGRRVEAVATTDIVSAPRSFLAEDVPTLLVSFARSGNSPESVAATHLAERYLTECHHLVITCNREGQLYRDHTDAAGSHVLLMPAASNDQGFAMTSSFTCMSLAARVALTGGWPDGDLVERLAAAAEHVLGAFGDAAREVAGAGFERIVYLGSGALTGLARECALKMLELTAGGVVTFFDSSLGFRHGPKSVLDTRTLTVVYLSNDPYTREYDLDIVAEVRQVLGDEGVLVVTAQERAEDSDRLGAVRTWVVPGLADAEDAELALVFAVCGQLLGLHFSLAIGCTPDNPSPSGKVNRVVEGVTIYPLPV